MWGIRECWEQGAGLHRCQGRLSEKGRDRETWMKWEMRHVKSGKKAFQAEGRTNSKVLWWEHTCLLKDQSSWSKVSPGAYYEIRSEMYTGCKSHQVTWATVEFGSCFEYDGKQRNLSKEVTWPDFHFKKESLWLLWGKSLLGNQECGQGDHLGGNGRQARENDNNLGWWKWYLVRFGTYLKWALMIRQNKKEQRQVWVLGEGLSSQVARHYHEKPVEEQVWGDVLGFRMKGLVLLERHPVETDI